MEKHTINDHLNPPHRRPKTMTWLLLSVWLILLVFGFLSVFAPSLLTGLNETGVETAAKGAKDAGDAYMREGHYDHAIQRYLTSLDIRPDYVGAQVNLAIAYGRSGRSGRGLKILEDALAGGTTRPGLVAYNLGDLLERQGDVEGAIEYYRKAMNSTVRPDRVWGKLGLAYQKLGRLDEAQAAFERAIEVRLDPRMSYQHMLRLAMHSQQDFPEAIAAIKEKLTAGITTEDLESYDLETIRQVQSGGRDYSMLLYHLGSVHVGRGDTGTAIECLREAVERWPRNKEAIELLRKQRSVRTQP